MLASEHLQGRLFVLPAFTNPDGSSNMNTVVAIFIIPLAVQWWSVWYPGSEPGGGRYVAQRMLAAKDEKHAVGRRSSSTPLIMLCVPGPGSW
jgi:SSS family solute:Na+ symporter